MRKFAPLSLLTVFSFLIFFFFLTPITHADFSNSLKVKKFHMPVCGKQNNDFNCHAHVVTDDKGNPDITVSPYGLGPAQFLGAYNVSGTASAIKTIAIVDAYDHPSILSDLNKYSQYFGIPTMASCPVSQGTLTRPCFQKVNQNGGSSYPAKNADWALEIALDVQTVHAMCQNCNILLVEANSASYTNLMTAVDRAVSMGAKIVSNSYGSSEFSTEKQYDFHFNKQGIAFTFSSGDSGYGTSYPAASPYVTAVGGTTLIMNNGNYVSESVWNGAGSGCSLYEVKPIWQKDTGCPNRTIADVSAVADPNTGAAIYSTAGYKGYKGWFQVGGTSLASPIVASIYALGTIPQGVLANSLPYANTASLHDITSGANGTCNPSYLCTGVLGFDGPTGLGSPNGTSSF